ncbi:hypothetical protein IQ22_01646 [Pseudomonas duriflava]|uniref:YqjK-like protein n=1 Tax=Pseudomonas duriflava TaxID=459528 RepID=A0A562QGC0_9PSED|nr:hypothetical protein [Pseudomonas duriflava]TWI55713.1 hypothetical protein IQ22_01646 [Pseudomonas duriflava]
MNQPLTAAVERDKRKQMVRLRMELYRQQLLYNAQPLHNPLGMLKETFRPKEALTQGKGPMVMGLTLLLTLFGKRLGSVGRLARLGLAVYPFVRRFQAVRQQHLHEQQQTASRRYRPYS